MAGDRARDDGWRLPDALWAEMAPLLLPERPKHPLWAAIIRGYRGSGRHGRDFLRPAYGAVSGMP